MKPVEELLEDAIRVKLEAINNGGDQNDTAVKELEQLYRLRIDESKAKSENCRSEKDGKSEVIDRRIKMAVDVAGIVLPLMLYRWLIIKGFQFEQTGFITSPTLKGLFGKIRPR